MLPPGNQVSQDSIEKPVRGRRGPATVSGSDAAGMSLGMEKHPTGRRSGARNWSQENCLIDNHREEIWLRMVCADGFPRTCERWGWGFRICYRQSGSDQMRDRTGCIIGELLVCPACRRQSRFPPEDACSPLRGKGVFLFAAASRDGGNPDVCAPCLPMPRRCSTEGFPGGFSSAGESLLIYFIQFYVVHPLWMMCRPWGRPFFMRCIGAVCFEKSTMDECKIK